jgi:lysyl-tRNA synthetase class 1
LQWKPDFGMRWAALDVDYEMFGKDHQPSAPLYTGICEVLGGTPPQQYVYEMFLDAEGKKISKSKGNGISIEQWLRYGPKESLSNYMYQSPRKAKRLYFDVIPRAVDEYQTYLEKFPKEEPLAQINNPVWHIHNGKPPASENIPSFNLLLNLAGVANTEDPKVLWNFIQSYHPEFTPQTHPFLNELVTGAVHYYIDFVKPTKKFRLPSDVETQALSELAQYLETTSDTTAEALQTQIYEIGKKHFADNLKGWFSCLYETLLGQPQGPRMGSFTALYGKANTLALIKRVLTKENLSA